MKPLVLVHYGTGGYMKRLEELNLVDDFLVNSLTSHKIYGERLKSLHKMVTAVKHDGEVGFTYLKSFEREQRIRAAGKAEGVALGKAEGKAETLLMILESKGKVAEELRAQIMAEADTATLDTWVRQALSSSSVEEFAAGLGQTGKDEE